jgi:hypothetical protein
MTRHCSRPEADSWGEAHGTSDDRGLNPILPLLERIQSLLQSLRFGKLWRLLSFWIWHHLIWYRFANVSKLLSSSSWLKDKSRFLRNVGTYLLSTLIISHKTAICNVFVNEGPLHPFHFALDAEFGICLEEPIFPIWIWYQYNCCCCFFV